MEQSIYRSNVLCPMQNLNISARESADKDGNSCEVSEPPLANHRPLTPSVLVSSCQPESRPHWLIDVLIMLIDLN